MLMNRLSRYWNIHMDLGTAVCNSSLLGYALIYKRLSRTNDGWFRALLGTSHVSLNGTPVYNNIWTNCPRSLSTAEQNELHNPSGDSFKLYTYRSSLPLHIFLTIHHKNREIWKFQYFVLTAPLNYLRFATSGILVDRYSETSFKRSMSVCVAIYHLKRYVHQYCTVGL